jgi:dihydrolipoamide dehydrogenase
LIYDLCVIGAGPGGYVAAIRAAQLGMKVACVEKRATLGGTCLNVGCIPSKALLHDSEHSQDFPAMMERKNKVVSGFTSGIEMLFKKNKVDWIKGEAVFESSTKLTNGIEAKHFLIATGSEPIELPFMPFDEKTVLSSTGMLALPQVPKKLLIIGAGVIGVELGSVYRRLGSEVTFIEALDRICPGFDRALSTALQKSLEKQGMTFLLSHKVTGYKNGVLTLQEGKELSGDVILVAVGRRPLSRGLNLEAVGITPDARGFIPVDGAFRTSCPNIYAIGDLIEGPMLAHKASEEGIAAVELIAGHTPKINYACIPNVAYTHPEVAAVGLTEEELKAHNVAYKASQFPFKANSRARCIADDEGFVRLYADATTHRLLGAHIFGPNASELIATATLALTLNATADQLASTCFAHPTLSESLKEASLGLFQSPLHI